MTIWSPCKQPPERLPVLAPVLGDFRDTFDGEPLSDFWTWTKSAAITSYILDGRLTLHHNGSTGNSSFSRVTSLSGIWGAGRSAIVEIIDSVLLGGFSPSFEFWLDGGNGSLWVARYAPQSQYGDVIRIHPTWLPSDEVVFVPYDPIQHRWLRYYHAGDRIHIMASSDGTDWAILADFPGEYPIWGTDMLVGPLSIRLGLRNAQPGDYVIFDNLGILWEPAPPFWSPCR